MPETRVCGGSAKPCNYYSFRTRNYSTASMTKAHCVSRLHLRFNVALGRDKQIGAPAEALDQARR